MIWRKREVLRLARWAAGVLVVLLLIVIVNGMRRHPRAAAKKTAPISITLPTPEPLGPPGIVLHDSDTPGRVHGRWVDERMLDRIHRDDHPQWADVCDGRTYHIGYHYVILANGVVQAARPENCLGAHARTHNDWLGVCLVGGFSTHRSWWPERPTARQMRSLVALCERLMSKYHIPPAYVKRHRDLNNTWCPGDRFPYRRLMAELKRYAAVHPETRPIPGRFVSLAIPRAHERKVYVR